MECHVENSWGHRCTYEGNVFSDVLKFDFIKAKPIHCNNINKLTFLTKLFGQVHDALEPVIPSFLLCIFSKLSINLLLPESKVALGNCSSNRLNVNVKLNAGELRERIVRREVLLECLSNVVIAHYDRSYVQNLSVDFSLGLVFHRDNIQETC